MTCLLPFTQELGNPCSRGGWPPGNLCCCQHGASCPRVAKGLCLVHSSEMITLLSTLVLHILGREENLLMISSCFPNLRSPLRVLSSSPWWLPCFTMGFSRETSQFPRYTNPWCTCLGSPFYRPGLWVNRLPTLTECLHRHSSLSTPELSLCSSQRTL